MNRKQLLIKSFQRGHLLNLKSKFYKNWIEKFVIDEMKGDIGKRGDITSNAVIKHGKMLKAVVRAREPGVVAGLEEASFLYLKNKIKVKPRKKDGTSLKKGDILLELYGEEKKLLMVERSAVDLIQRMSGIATITKKMTSISKVPIAPTRKTQWRYLDKKAVFIGGGLTHRLALWDSILIKDNHLTALKREGIKNPIDVSIERAWKSGNSTGFIEIEVSNFAQAKQAAIVFKGLKKRKIPFLIMFDNMSSKSIIKTLNHLKKMDLYNHILFEASGGITPENILEYSKTGVDVISMGYLTHSAQALDIKQHIL
jgi:nicotinate-nucleotide pyrophosphorylase (carboxylating)